MIAYPILGSSQKVRYSFLLVTLWALTFTLLVNPINAILLNEDAKFSKRAEESAQKSVDYPHYETRDDAWKAIEEAHKKGNSMDGAYIKSTGILITDIKIEDEKLTKRFSIGGLIKHFFPGAGRIIPGISFTEHQVNMQGVYFTDWKPSSCPFYNDKSTSDVRHDFTTTLTNTRTWAPGFDINIASVFALKLGAEITKTNTLTRLDSYTIKAGAICQLWVRPLRLWQNQQYRQCKKTSLTSNDKTCTSWSAIVQGNFLVQNKTIGNLRCGEDNVQKNNCGE